MASLPLLTSRDGVLVVTALLGYARPAPPSSTNVHALDCIFDDVIDSLRMGLPLRAEIEAGAAAVASVLNALQDASQTTVAPACPPPSAPPPAHHNVTDGQPALITSNTPVQQAPSSQPLQTPLYQAQPALSSTPSTASDRPTPPLPPQPTGRTRRRAASPRAGAPSPAPLRRAARQKRYHDAQPSVHCHVCCRSSSSVPVATCGNFKRGTCRKVVCNRCVAENGWDWEAANAKVSTWICPHCKENCAQVPRAQCHVYGRTNLRRRMNGLKNKRLRTGDGRATTVGEEGNAG